MEPTAKEPAQTQDVTFANFPPFPFGLYPPPFFRQYPFYGGAYPMPLPAKVDEPTTPQESRQEPESKRSRSPSHEHSHKHSRKHSHSHSRSRSRSRSPSNGIRKCVKCDAYFNCKNYIGSMPVCSVCNLKINDQRVRYTCETCKEEFVTFSPIQNICDACCSENPSGLRMCACCKKLINWRYRYCRKCVILGSL